MIKKEQVNKFLKPKFNVREDKKYEIKAIKDCTIYNKAVDGQLLELYYLISLKSYSKDEKPTARL